MASSDDRRSTSEIDSLRIKLRQTEANHAAMEKKFEEWKRIAIDNQEMAKKVEQMLEKERNDRKKVEEQAVQMLAQIKEKYELKIKSITTQCNESKIIKDEDEKNRKKIADLQMKLERANEEIERIKQRTNSKEQNIKSSEEEVKKYKKRMNELEYELQKANKEIEKANKEIEKANKEIEKAKKENEKLNRERTNHIEVDDDKSNTRVSELGFDLKMANKEIERLKERITTIREINMDLRKEMSALKEVADEKTLKAKDNEIKELKNKIASLEDNHQIEKAKLEERVKTMENHCKDLKDFQNGNINWQNKYEESQKRIDNLSNQMKNIETSKHLLQMNFDKIKSELNEKQAVINKLTRTNEVLKTACTQIEQQAEAFRIKYEGTNEQKMQLLNSKSETVNEIQKLFSEIEQLKDKLENVNKEKDSLVTRMEIDCVNFEKQLKNEREKIKNFELELANEKQRLIDYEDRLSEKDQCLFSTDETVTKLQERNCQLEQELIAIKEEAANHITTITALRKENYKLMKNLENEMKRFDKLEQRFLKLQREMEANEEARHQEEITLKETISQQLKLIDFLKDKNDTLERQKKPWFALTPSKSSSCEQHQNHNLEWKDLDRALAEERTKSRRLSEELEKTKDQLNHLTAKLKLHPLKEEKNAKPTAPPVSDEDLRVLNSKRKPSSDISSDIREIEAIINNEHEEDEFSFTDSLLEDLQCEVVNPHYK